MYSDLYHYHYSEDATSSLENVKSYLPTTTKVDDSCDLVWQHIVQCGHTTLYSLLPMLTLRITG